jgi:hypothetical protein
MSDGLISYMVTFRRSRFIAVTRALLVLLVITMAGRSEANCSPPVSEPNVIDMVGSLHPSPLDHSDQRQSGMCHLGCPVLLTAAEARSGDAGLLPPTYVAELAPLMVGISDIPQTPPPRFG